MSFVTAEEHEQGWKQVEVGLRSGKKVDVVLQAVTRAQFRQVELRKAREPELDEVLELCRLSLGEQKPLLDQVDPFSARLIEATVLEMTYGSEAMGALIKKAGEKLEGERPNVPAPAMPA